MRFLLVFAILVLVQALYAGVAWLLQQRYLKKQSALLGDTLTLEEKELEMARLKKESDEKKTMPVFLLVFFVGAMFIFVIN